MKALINLYMHFISKILKIELVMQNVSNKNVWYSVHLATMINVINNLKSHYMEVVIHDIRV